jgi:hypothetical protein
MRTAHFCTVNIHGVLCCMCEIYLDSPRLKPKKASRERGEPHRFPRPGLDWKRKSDERSKTTSGPTPSWAVNGLRRSGYHSPTAAGLLSVEPAGMRTRILQVACLNGDGKTMLAS